ncbi:MAG: cell division topological specificity factor MinE [Clostridiales bacterium]
MSGVLAKFFGKESELDASKSIAKERLRLVLVHDRMDISEQTMNNLREDLIEVIGRYMEIDTEGLEVSLTREDEGVALIANIPVLNVKRHAG